MINKDKQLYFNSADMPNSQLVIHDGDDIIASPDVLTENQMRLEAVKYMGLCVLDGAATAAKATGDYMFWVVTRHYPGE